MPSDAAAATLGDRARRLVAMPQQRRSLAVVAQTALDMANNLIDPLSFDVLTASLACANGASGFWTPPSAAHALAADFPAGAVVLTTGLASLADGLSSTSNGAGASKNTAGDTDLSAVVGGNTYDACSLTISAKAKTKGKITFEYVFASEEYLEYVDQFNDGFLLLYSDATTPKTNVAIVPGTSPAQAVTINNVNNVDNKNHFRQPAGTEYDGLTTLLTTKPIIVAKDQEWWWPVNAFDSILDSAVFVKANSVSLFNTCSKSCATGTVPAGSCQVDSVCEYNDLIEQVCSAITTKDDGSACVISGSNDVAGQCAAGVCKDVTAPTFTTGSETITVEGNTLGAPLCSPFDGFLPPITPKDDNVLATASGTIPVKWSLTNPAWGQLAPGYPKLAPITCGTDPAPKKTDAGEFLADALATLKLTPTQAVMTFQGKGRVESGKCYRFDILLAGSCGVTDAHIRSFRIRVK
ncbi:hypothetical protein HXX76_010941 [Chlamydomonas incerta]|uniref:Uncharacterized protein n=1 Tax=Chlamydomonas incerta TaxID=51695 RepID=A0A835S9F5_CHLIN|nr:hypothetical protein HXX76_010941 [Chlamydomonas incerta]|eukprot:KAG2423173.1 hypothetical protein HXX76_010941 [Chlamydomonas incerta]